MEEAKLRFLFGVRPPGGLDPHDVDDRSELVRRAARRGLGPAVLALREVLANQVIEGDPPAVWPTAQRLLGLGLDRERVMSQLTMVLASTMKATLGPGGGWDMAAYETALNRLPMPEAAAVEAALIDLVREHPGIRCDDLDELTLTRVGADEGDELAAELLDRVSDELLDDPDGPLAMLAGDRMVHVGDLTNGIVLTHRLSEIERSVGTLTVGFDLVGFSRLDDLSLPDGEQLEAFSVEHGHVAWRGPGGWLDAYPADSLLAVRVSPDAVVSIEVLDIEPAAAPGLVERLLAAYEVESEEPGLPVAAEGLLLGLLLEDRATFAVPKPALAELCQMAGLERRTHEVAAGEEEWANKRKIRRIIRAVGAFDDRRRSDAAIAVMTAFEEGEDDPDTLRTAVRGMRDPDVLTVVTNWLLDETAPFFPATASEHATPIDLATEFGERVLSAARRPAEVAAARWLAAVLAERNGEPVVAEAHLQIAVDADPSFAPAVDRLAWYMSDRGDAAGAVRLWRSLPVGQDRNADLRTVAPFARPAGQGLGRNEPCWCGSGRKHKHCHLGQPVAAPLEERVGWLCRKSIAYLERRGGTVSTDVFEHAEIRAVDPDDPDSVAEALEDPLVLDVVLLEGGWFERFLAERGPLLPDDEALLGAAWALIPRTLYEIVSVDPGARITMRDLGAGETVEVRERSFSRQARPGEVYCARAVPAGNAHQLIGGIFQVTAGTEANLLTMCDEGDGFGILDYAARQHRPPRLATREGEPIVICEAVIDLRDPAEARRVLDDAYEPDGDGSWVEMHPIGDERILRAQIRLDSGQLVVNTHSEARMDRVLATLRAGLTGCQIVNDIRSPLEPGDLPPPPAGYPDPNAAGPAIDPGVAAEIQDKLERRWISEPVPALAGLSPLEAAADPSRREQLIRLLASFDDDAPDDLIAMRPNRLRELLDLPAR